MLASITRPSPFPPITSLQTQHYHGVAHSFAQRQPNIHRIFSNFRTLSIVMGGGTSWSGNCRRLHRLRPYRPVRAVQVLHLVEQDMPGRANPRQRLLRVQRQVAIGVDASFRVRRAMETVPGSVLFVSVLHPRVRRSRRASNRNRHILPGSSVDPIVRRLRRNLGHQDLVIAADHSVLKKVRLLQVALEKCPLTRRINVIVGAVKPRRPDERRDQFAYPPAAYKRRAVRVFSHDVRRQIGQSKLRNPVVPHRKIIDAQVRRGRWSRLDRAAAPKRVIRQVCIHLTSRGISPALARRVHHAKFITPRVGQARPRCPPSIAKYG